MAPWMGWGGGGGKNNKLRHTLNQLAISLSRADLTLFKYAMPKCCQRHRKGSRHYGNVVLLLGMVGDNKWTVENLSVEVLSLLLHRLLTFGHCTG
jgi:hypothetical protein